MYVCGLNELLCVLTPSILPISRVSLAARFSCPHLCLNSPAYGDALKGGVFCQGAHLWGLSSRRLCETRAMWALPKQADRVFQSDLEPKAAWEANTYRGLDVSNPVWPCLPASWCSYRGFLSSRVNGLAQIHLDLTQHDFCHLLEVHNSENPAENL